MDGTQILDVPAGLVETGPDVYAFEVAPLVALGGEHLAFLRAHAARSPRRRARICTHRPEDAVHEMLIVHHRSVYVRPHRHARKSESLAVIEGAARVVLFDDGGAIDESVALNEPVATDARFYYRIPPGRWHALAIDSEWFVFHEVVAGPFVRSETEFPSWAPSGDDEARAAAYLARLRRELHA